MGKKQVQVARQTLYVRDQLILQEQIISSFSYLR